MSGPFIPLDIWLSITRHLQLQDVLNASMTCRKWYKSLAYQTVWEAVYKTILPEYPTDHFLIPNLVENVKRLDFIPLDKSEPQVLDQWPQSWKQRTVYLQHVIYVQSNAVTALRTRTDSFEEDIDDKPFHDIAKIKTMEEFAKSPLPIDLVIFLYYFTHHLLVKQPENYEELVMPLASGIQFETEHGWKDLTRTFNIRLFERSCPTKRAIRLKNISPTTRKYMLQSKVVPFAQFSEYECDGLKNGLSVMLSKNDLPPPDLPDHVANMVYRVNLENMLNGTGKVFFVSSVTTFYEFDMYYVSESFTDYLIQYAGVGLEYGTIPQYMKDMGANDLVVPLPRDQSPRKSILLPQPVDWDIGSYFPTYFTKEPDIEFPFLYEILDRQYRPDAVESQPYPEFDNPDAIPFGCPPYDLLNCMSAMNWKPYHDLLADRNPSPAMNRLIDFGSGKHPEKIQVEMNQDIYDMLQRRAQEWIASTPSTISNTSRFNEVEVELIQQKTGALHELFQLHQRCLPICLYYFSGIKSLHYIETEKYFQDHLNGVNSGTPKYSSDELDTISTRLKNQLNRLGFETGRFPSLHHHHINKVDLSNIIQFTWEQIE